MSAPRAQAGPASRPKSRTEPTRDERGHAIEFIARGVALDGQRVLLCQNLKHGYFYLPGGHVEFAESASAALVREFLEETGAVIKVGRPLMIDETSFATRKRRHHEINVVFHVELPGGGAPRAIRSREPGIAFVWADLAAVPELDIRPLSAKAFLASGAGLALDQSGACGVEWVSAMGAD